MIGSYTVKNIWNLGIKELIGLLRDPLLIALIFYTMTIDLYNSAESIPDSLHNATIAIVDEDNSQLSKRFTDAFMPPMFMKADIISLQEMDRHMDTGRYTFVLVIPPDAERDVLAKRRPKIQLNVDATRVSQAYCGAGYIEQIVQEETYKFIDKGMTETRDIVTLNFRDRFNPNLTSAWFGAVGNVITQLSMLAIVLTGAAVIRERERGTLEHLMVMPATPFEIMVSKIWSMSFVLLFACYIATAFVINKLMGIPINGSIWLFMFGVALHVFAMTSMGIMLSTIADSMAQLGMLMILILLPMNILSGTTTPLESMPPLLQKIVQIFPTTHFATFGRGILFRGSSFLDIWDSFAWIFGIGAVSFSVALSRFRKMIGS